MRSRFNHHLQSRYFPVRPISPITPITQSEPRQSAPSSRPSSSRPRTQPAFSQACPAEATHANPELILEDEIPVAELNAFALSCIEQLSLSKKDSPPEQVITHAISDKLPSYTSLKTEFLSSRHTHRTHHVWTQQMYDAVKPLLKNESAPEAEQENLSNLATQCVEQNLQLEYRVGQLRRRLKFLEESVTRHLIQIGQEVGLPTSLMHKIGNLTKTLMEQYS